MRYPRMIHIQQHFSTTCITDVVQTVKDELTRLDIASQITPGDTVALSAGSRGITNIAVIIKTVVEVLQHHGAEPFIVPAMGSHGGATAEGQQAILAGYGITEEAMNAPIKATMDVVQVGSTPEGVPVFFDRYASEADHVIVINRIKPHTEFVGNIESGLHKMMLIGLGKHRGASTYHQAIVNYSFDHIIRSVGQAVLDTCRVLCGLAIIENQKHETALIEAIRPADFYLREQALFIRSKELMPRLPFDSADLLIVDYIGKEISGGGLDPNIVGRKYHYHRAAPEEFPKITRIYVRDLTEATHGNASGFGLAEYTHTRAVRKMNPQTTYTNAVTANSPASVAIPIHYDSDRKALDAALQTIGFVQPEQARIIRINNTLDLEHLLVSEAYAEEIRNHPNLSIVKPAHEMEFTEEGNLL